MYVHFLVYWTVALSRVSCLQSLFHRQLVRIASASASPRRLTSGYIWVGRVFGTVVKMPLGHLNPILERLGSVQGLALLPIPASYQCAPWEAAGDGSSGWGPATRVEDLD